MDTKREWGIYYNGRARAWVLVDDEGFDVAKFYKDPKGLGFDRVMAEFVLEAVKAKRASIEKA